MCRRVNVVSRSVAQATGASALSSVLAKFCGRSSSRSGPSPSQLFFDQEGRVDAEPDRRGEACCTSRWTARSSESHYLAWSARWSQCTSLLRCWRVRRWEVRRRLLSLGLMACRSNQNRTGIGGDFAQAPGRWSRYLGLTLRCHLFAQQTRTVVDEAASAIGPSAETGEDRRRAA